MSKPTERQKVRKKIRLRLGTIEQLFNPMDPSPLQEKDLDGSAEEFIVSWAQEFKTREPLALVIQVERGEADLQTQAQVRQAVQNYFKYRARLNRRELSRLMSQGRVSLAIGLGVLMGAFGARELMAGWGEGTLAEFARESVIIAAWVAMWRPMQTYLYDWWPLWRRGRIFRKLGRVPVTIRSQRAGAPTVAP